jgi:hypothetical protein
MVENFAFSQLGLDEVDILQQDGYRLIPAVLFLMHLMRSFLSTEWGTEAQLFGVRDYLSLVDYIINAMCVFRTCG